MKRVKVLVLAAVLVLLTVCMAACGKQKTEDAKPEKSGTSSSAQTTSEAVKEDDGVYRATIEQIERNDSEGEYEDFKFCKDGKLYYTVSKYDQETEKSKAVIRIVDSETGEKIGDDIELKFENENTYLSLLVPGGDDAFVFSAYSYDGLNQNIFIGKCSLDGTVLNLINYRDLPGAAEEEYLTGNIVSDGTNVYLAIGNKLVMLDGELRYKKAIMDINYPNMCVGNDGLLYVFKDYQGELSSYDPKTDKVEEDIVTVPSVSYLYTGGEDELLIANSSSLKSLNTKTWETVRLFDFLDIDIGQQGFKYMYRKSDDEIVLYFFVHEEQEMDMGDGNKQRIMVLVPRKATVKRYEKGEVPEVETITLACYYANSEVTKAVTSYNQAHPDIKVKIKCYSDNYSDWDEMQEAFDRDILENAGYDIIMFDSSNYGKYSDKGLLEDLAPILENDPSFDLNDYYEKILFASKEGDKLYSLVNGAYISAFMGNEKVFGKKEKLSVKDIYDARKQLGNIPFISYGSNVNVLFTMLQNDYRLFLGGEEGVYNFNTAEFRELCEFAATFPDWNDGMSNMYDTQFDDAKAGKIVLLHEFFSGGETYLLDRARVGKDMRAYGAPSSDGNGYYISYGTRFSINAFSNYKEEAWEIIKALLKSRPDHHGYQFRANKEVAKADIDTLYDWCNNNGEYGARVMMNNEEFILSMDEEDIKVLENMVEGATLSCEMDDTIREIIGDEIESYFHKEKSLDDVINVIQKRVNLYLEEKK